MMQYGTFIFDLDGTLLNTLGDLANSVNYALQSCGLPTRTVEQVRLSVGNGVEKLIERVVPSGRSDSAFDAVHAAFRRHYIGHSLDTTKPYDGVCEMLAELRHRGVRMAVVSNKFQAATEQLCRRFFPATVEVAIGEGGGIRRKPAPDGVLEALRRLGVGVEGTVYVGDSDVDVATAKAACLPCISVTWGFRDRAFLEACGATAFADHPSDLLRL